MMAPFLNKFSPCKLFYRTNYLFEHKSIAMKKNQPQVPRSRQPLNQERRIINKVAETLKQQTSSDPNAETRSTRNDTKDDLSNARETPPGRYGLDFLL